MKKLIIVGVFVFAIALTANVAFATYNPCDFCHDNDNDCLCPSITVNNSNSLSGINNITIGKALTGKNKLVGFGLGITSGNGTVSVSAANTLGANQTEITSGLPITVNNSNSISSINNVTKGVAKTGKNMVFGVGSITSGAGVTSVSGVNMIGTNLTLINQ